MTPFEVLYIRKPRDLGIIQLEDTTVPDLVTSLKEHEVMNYPLQQQLQRTQHHMKQQADKHCTELEFNVEDHVYLKLQPYIQSSVAHRSN